MPQAMNWNSWWPPRWGREILGNSVAAWLTAIIVFAALFFVLRLVKAIVCHRARKLEERTGSKGWTAVHTLVQATHGWFLLITALYASAYPLYMPTRAHAVVRSLMVIALLVQAALWSSVAVRLATQRWTRDRLQSDPASAPVMLLVGYIGRVAIWTFVLLLALENLGIQVTALLTGLGIGGIAVALSLQNILGDLFASLSIMVDKPFVIGDYIIVGDLMGTVENIGLKTTRVRSLWGEQLVFPNGELLKSRIRNFKRMNERRVLLTISVTYDTPSDKLEALPGIFKQIIEAQSSVRFDRAHLKGVGGASLDFEIVYYVLSPEYDRYMDVQQAINLELIRQFAKEEIKLAGTPAATSTPPAPPSSKDTG